VGELDMTGDPTDPGHHQGIGEAARHRPPLTRFNAKISEIGEIV
jgi:hypothetical protein